MSLKEKQIYIVTADIVEYIWIENNKWKDKALEEGLSIY